MPYQIGIVGAAGYAGIELVRRVLEHPGFNLKVVTSNADAGQRLDTVYPSFTGKTDLVFQKHSAPELLECDAAFLAVPHTASLGMTPGLIDAGVTVIDLSADYRLKDPALYEKWYGTPHTSPNLLAHAAFGLPELAPEDIARAAADHAAGKAVLVACAGCFPTATTLAAYPAVHAGWTQGVVNAEAISGVTGAGKKPTARTHFCGASDNAEAYGVQSHRHTPEMEQILGLPGRVVFVPHLVPMRRGLLSTVTLQLTDEAAAGMTAAKALAFYADFYKESPFVQVLPEGRFPRTDSVVGTNNAHIGIAYHANTHTLIAVCAIDNLGKGAADQAVQCANIVFGLPQDAGLGSVALPV